MRLRNLELKDAPLMLEWMHDEDVVGKLRGNFLDKTIEDAENFIKSAQDKSINAHFAIVSDEDEYMGTVSLKNIENGSAEFAITIRRSAMGLGYARKAMELIGEYAKYTLGLKYVYWYVSPDNTRALRFYDKNGYSRVEITSINEQILGKIENYSSYYWYLLAYK